MPEKIGKYEVIERIGRGGMGMIFKAHDPVLDRAVALKVISTEIEVTDELRARFFREAQACARLSHPNIVTVYDMGEDDGRFFIVMEFLEGEELRRLITQRKPLKLEDKLAVMLQVCDGLHYAHEKGVVHRDIKPGNIFVLRNGQAKILDFGIAQIATTEAGLTRTGLIMGTLRYISPEQVRGRADHRSDIFSVGAVFYEFLSFRPAFTGEDPMHLLEQLRSDDPPSLIELDPTIPPDLAAIVEHAMRKDPADRFGDLDQMRGELEQVQRAIIDEAQRMRGNLRGQLDQVRELKAALARLIGAPAEPEPVRAVTERAGLRTMQGLDQEIASGLDALRAKMARADALAPAFERGTKLLQAGQAAAAVVEFEAIVADMPEHARAQEGLREARAQAEVQRRQQLAAKLLQDARGALDEGGYAVCLGILKQAEEIPAPAEAAPEIVSLRQAAEAGLAAQAEKRRLRHQAEEARAATVQARRKAEAQAAPQDAPAAWSEAEAKSAEAHAAFSQEAYAEAGRAFEAATAAYGRFEEAARAAKLRERQAAEQGQAEMAQSRQQAQEARAPQYAADLWDDAEVKSAEAQTALARQAVGRAAGIFNEAAALYRQAHERALEARQRERRRAEEARDGVAQAQREAAAVDAERHAPALWSQAAAKVAEGQAALAREQHGKAAEAFGAALTLYSQAETQARDERRRDRGQADRGRKAMEESRRSALAADAAAHAPSDWREAEASAASGEAAFAREAYAEASHAFDQSLAQYHRAEERTREAGRARADAEKGREAASLARRAAVDAHASKFAAEAWTAGESAEARANAALSRQEYGAARQLFTEARGRYAAAVQAASVAAEAEGRLVEARRLLESGDITACLRRVNDVLALRPGHEAAERLRAQAEETLRQAGDATVRRPIAPAPLAERPTELIEAPAAPTVITPVPPPRAQPPTVFARTPTAGADAAAVPVEQRTPARAIPERPRAARDAATAPRRGIAWPSGRALKAGGLVLGGLAAAAAIAIFYWQTPGTPPVSAPVQQATPAPPTSAPPVSAPAKAPAPALATVAPPVSAPAKAPAPAPATVAPPVVRPAEEARREAEARAAASRVVEARRAAELVQAPKLAGALWADAGVAQRKAEDTLKQQAFDRAQVLFSDAEKRYRAAAKAASDSAAAAGAEQERIAAGKRAGEEAERAASEEKQRVAALQSEQARGSEQSRNRTAAQRERAVKAEADRLAKDLFDAAQAKQTEADGLAGRQNFAAASLAYQDAADRYLEAVHRAQIVRDARAQADSAKTRMLIEKLKARSDSPEFRDGLVEERQGTALYERLAYKEAAERFRTAETLFTRGAAPVAPTPPPPAPAPAPPKRRPPISGPG